MDRNKQVMSLAEKDLENNLNHQWELHLYIKGIKLCLTRLEKMFRNARFEVCFDFFLLSSTQLSNFPYFLAFAYIRAFENFGFKCLVLYTCSTNAL